MPAKKSNQPVSFRIRMIGLLWYVVILDAGDHVMSYDGAYRTYDAAARAADASGLRDRDKG